MHPSTGHTAVSDPSHTARASWMRVLALADSHALNHAMQSLGALPTHHTLRAPEAGMVMVRARAGGTGAQFNLGEMSVTRCAIKLEDDTMGVAYVQGRGQRHAEQAAVLDALLQRADWHDRVRALVVEPLARAHQDRQIHRGRLAAQTQVEFFTMVRGED
ncbi:phosphonate C-P lyase system protein PhnG [Bordetella sp. 15P40C-2]|uniref:phosphonate C-P lyase system protein PhnG n=1 Tax=Bordetella sp. 15P40C-2 TaxID=2572246 RepID=UPI0013239543|nr:phosphonate C-P lyase system protein PhnG [Bordetella sp. 15P40C-2]MVW70816.1 phosphonate C-P lyase system protein PhnG [Bordetella sp. 15P40C-2]